MLIKEKVVRVKRQICVKNQHLYSYPVLCLQVFILRFQHVRDRAMVPIISIADQGGGFAILECKRVHG